MPIARQCFDGPWVKRAVGQCPRRGRAYLDRAVGGKIAQQGLSHDRPGGVLGADEQDVPRAVGRGREAGLNGGYQVRPCAAHVQREVAEQRLGDLYVDGIEQRPAIAVDVCQTAGHQIGQMMRQGVLFDRKRSCDFGRADALGREPHQQAERGQSAGVAEGREGAGGERGIHISRFMEIWIPVE